jgi:hypothetical protein
MAQPDDACFAYRIKERMLEVCDRYVEKPVEYKKLLGVIEEVGGAGSSAS